MPRQARIYISARYHCNILSDADSNATKTTRANGSIVNRTFDAFGNVLTQSVPFNIKIMYALPYA
ncbi:MAG: hypothetical protein HRT92_03630 [Piscirickettsiaceae bacterium]|nr:hypothetical protein [Piscirickettsiaceae bacterium]